MRCRFKEESVRPKKEAGKPKEKREEIEAETGFDVNVHFATLSQSADSKRSRSDQREKQANPKRSEREIEAETGFDVNVHFATLSQSADSKRSRSDQREKQANPKRSKRKSKR